MLASRAGPHARTWGPPQERGARCTRPAEHLFAPARSREPRALGRRGPAPPLARLRRPLVRARPPSGARSTSAFAHVVRLRLSPRRREWGRVGARRSSSGRVAGGSRTPEGEAGRAGREGREGQAPPGRSAAGRGSAPGGGGRARATPAPAPQLPAAHGGAQSAGGGRGPAESLRSVESAPGTASALVTAARRPGPRCPGRAPRPHAHSGRVLAARPPWPGTCRPPPPWAPRGSRTGRPGAAGRAGRGSGRTRSSRPRSSGAVRTGSCRGSCPSGRSCCSWPIPGRATTACR